MATRVLVERGSFSEADGMCAPAGVDGCTPWAELVASTAGRPHDRKANPMADRAGQVLTAMSRDGVVAAPRMRPSALAGAPGALQCLQCQLAGRRRLTCARRDLCLEPPHVYPVGPILLLAWLVIAAAFVTSVW